MSERTICEVADCSRPVERSGLCATHRKRLQRGSLPIAAPVQERYASAFGRLQEAAIKLADAERDDDYDRAKTALEAAARAYATRAT